MEKLFRFYAWRGVGWWYWPYGHQPRPPESKDRRSASCAEATDSEAHGIPAGPVFRLRNGLRLERQGSRSCEGAGELREDGEVGVKPDPFKATDAKGR